MEVDDTDPHIAYSGSWQEIIGSTRQWGGGTVHSTTQNGASATITFSGTRIILYCTLKAGTGDEIVDINFDGQKTSSTQISQSADVYNDVWWDSGEIANSQHTLIVSNGGGPSDTPFQIDRFHVEGVLLSPAIAAPPPPPTTQPAPSQSAPAQAVQVTTATTTKVATVTANPSDSSNTGSSSHYSNSVSGSSSASSSTSSNPPSYSLLTSTGAGGQTTVLSVQYITTTGSDGTVSVSTQVANSDNSRLGSSSKTPIAAIAGGVIGGLMLMLLLLLLLCLRRRRRNARQHLLLADDAEKLAPRPRKLTDVTPFRINANRDSGTVAISHDMEFAPKYGSSPKGPVGSTSTTSPLGAEASTAFSAYNGSSSNGRTSTDKSPDLLSEDTHSSSMYASATGLPYLEAPSRRHPEVDAGPYRPRYLSGDTVIAGTSSSIYVAMLTPQDTNDIPPSYQSARNHSPNPHPYPLTPSFLGQ